MNAVTLPGTLDALSPIRDYVKQAAASVGLDHTAAYNLTLAVDEIATNVVRHGYEEAGLKGEISIAATRKDDSLVITLSDQGAPYDPHLHREPDDEGLSQELSDRPIGGLGIMLAKDSVDDLQYESNDQGNVHRFVVRLKPAPEPVLDEHRQLEILLRITKSLGQQIQLDPLLELIVAEVTGAMHAERSSLLLVDRKKPDELVSRIAQGSQEIRIPFGVGIAGTCAQTRQTINIPDAYKDSRFNPAFDKSSGFRTRSILTTPIIDKSSNRLIGVVQVLNKKGAGAFTEDDEKFLDAICVHLGIALQRAEMVEAYLQSQIVAKSLELAKEIQLGLVPKDFPAPPEFKDLDIYAAMIPALEVGGDLYDFFFLDKDRLCFIIGDVSDKGIPAALFMAMTRTAFKMSAHAAPESISPTKKSKKKKKIFKKKKQMFVTAFAGILDLRTGRVEYADAGHEPPFILRPSGDVLKVFKVGGIVLGFLPDYEYGGGHLQLEPGDALVLYTDGVTEAMNMEHNLFGADAIEKTLAKGGSGAGSAKIIEGLLEDMRVFVGEARQSDDITALVLHYLGRDHID